MILKFKISSKQANNPSTYGLGIVIFFWQNTFKQAIQALASAGLSFLKRYVFFLVTIYQWLASKFQNFK